MAAVYKQKCLLNQIYLTSDSIVKKQLAIVAILGNYEHTLHASLLNFWMFVYIIDTCAMCLLSYRISVVVYLTLHTSYSRLQISILLSERLT